MLRLGKKFFLSCYFFLFWKCIILFKFLCFFYRAHFPNFPPSPKCFTQCIKLINHIPCTNSCSLCHCGLCPAAPCIKFCLTNPILFALQEEQSPPSSMVSMTSTDTRCSPHQQHLPSATCFLKALRCLHNSCSHRNTFYERRSQSFNATMCSWAEGQVDSK